MAQEKAEESRPITIPKDEPETQTPVPVQEASTEPTEPVEEKVRSELEKYPYSLEDLNKMYGNLRTLASEADKSIAAIHSIQREKDWFDNPIETMGQYAGIIIGSGIFRQRSSAGHCKTDRFPDGPDCDLCRCIFFRGCPV